jgi:CheY-like chemotaxis protein
MVHPNPASGSRFRREDSREEERPRTPDEGEPADVAAISASSALVRLDGLRVLVVDDEADARRVLVMVPEQVGAMVTAAGSAREATASLHEARPDVLVSDLGMPAQDGFDLIKQVRSVGYDAWTLPAVALTAFVHKDDARLGLLGFQVHMPKPVDPHDLHPSSPRSRGAHRLGVGLPPFRFSLENATDPLYVYGTSGQLDILRGASPPTCKRGRWGADRFLFRERTMNNMNRLKFHCLVACMMAAVVGYASSATAADPPGPPDFTLEFAAGVACSGFDLRIEGWGGKGHLREFTDKNGNVVRSLDAGTGFALRFTNLLNSATFSTKSNGAVAQKRYNADGSYTDVVASDAPEAGRRRRAIDWLR